ncbi:MAG: (d)CMP kinase [candidate division Zixibacteria bacterium]|nr:(d)CMP kinase [candidate division Zixibacteria bacterium]
MTSPKSNSIPKNCVIALDGPAGSGKSTTARMLAARLKYNYLDTGAMYRALTVLALRRRVLPSDGVVLKKLADEMQIRFETQKEVNRVFVDGEDMTERIRMPEITRHVSEVSAHRGVREAMVGKQQELGKEGNIVAEGRDTTTVVFPDAHLKVYLDASLECRAQRRLLDMVKLGIETSLEEQEADLRRRDTFDSGRQHSPLRRAEDAYLIDTTHMTIDEQVDKIISLLKTAAKGK